MIQRSLAHKDTSSNMISFNSFAFWSSVSHIARYTRPQCTQILISIRCFLIIQICYTNLQTKSKSYRWKFLRLKMGMPEYSEICVSTTNDSIDAKTQTTDQFSHLYMYSTVFYGHYTWTA